MRRPTLKTLAANHAAAAATASPATTLRHTCHAGGGVPEARRASMAKVFTGGTKLSTMLSEAFGAVPL
jgi:hypothetical protein